MTATVKESKDAVSVDDTKTTQRDVVGDIVSSAVSQSMSSMSQPEKSQQNDIGKSSTVSQSKTTQRDDVDEVMSPVASQVEANQKDGVDEGVSSTVSLEVGQSADGLEEKVIYTEEQTVSMAMVTTKSDMVDNDEKSEDITHDDALSSYSSLDTRGSRRSLHSDRMDAVPLSHVSNKFTYYTLHLVFQ